MHYLGNLDPTNTLCPCAWIYCACSITTLKVFDDTSFRETNGIGMELFGLGKHAEKVMRNCWQNHYARFHTLFPYYEVDLDANEGLVSVKLEQTSVFSTHVESAGDTTEMLGSSSLDPQQVMKAYDENPKKLKIQSRVKTEEDLFQDVKKEEPETVFAEYGLVEVKLEPLDETAERANDEFFEAVKVEPKWEEQDPEAGSG